MGVQSCKTYWHGGQVWLIFPRLGHHQNPGTSTVKPRTYSGVLDIIYGPDIVRKEEKIVTDWFKAWEIVWPPVRRADLSFLALPMYKALSHFTMASPPTRASTRDFGGAGRPWALDFLPYKQGLGTGYLWHSQLHSFFIRTSKCRPRLGCS